MRVLYGYTQGLAPYLDEQTTSCNCSKAYLFIKINEQAL
jgi:hypothetical protein